MTLETGSRVPSELVEAEILDADGGAHRLGSALGDVATLLVFLRHFGCTGCAQQLDVLVPHLASLHELGLETVLIGSGTPAHLADFCERQRLEGYPLRAYTDPTTTSHRAAGLSRSPWRVVGPAALAREVMVRTMGYTSGRKEGDVMQSGGVVILCSRTVAFFRQARVAAEPVPAAAIVEAAVATISAHLVETARVSSHPII